MRKSLKSNKIKYFEKLNLQELTYACNVKEN